MLCGFYEASGKRWNERILMGAGAYPFFPLLLFHNFSSAFLIGFEGKAAAMLNAKSDEDFLGVYGLSNSLKWGIT